ncbi:MAG TPA: outer membrane beta-barrel protein [Flavilitoribacter sp.]|nr:outer membrane beta-barrel protein [Flavilitoribacter sp.]HMQ88806.1 outer membrane beta-barrel protein [Flavilitoribacter sp.]
MKTQDFDRHVRKTLNGYDSELDTESLWLELGPKLNGVKRSAAWKSRGWLGFGLLAMTLLLGGLFFKGVDWKEQPAVETRPHHEKDLPGEGQKTMKPLGASPESRTDRKLPVREGEPLTEAASNTRIEPRRGLLFNTPPPLKAGENEINEFVPGKAAGPEVNPGAKDDRGGKERTKAQALSGETGLPVPVSSDFTRENTLASDDTKKDPATGTIGYLPEQLPGDSTSSNRLPTDQPGPQETNAAHTKNGLPDLSSTYDQTPGSGHAQKPLSGPNAADKWTRIIGIPTVLDLTSAKQNREMNRLPGGFLPNTSFLKKLRWLAQVEYGAGRPRKFLGQHPADAYLEARKATESPLEFFRSGFLAGVQEWSGFYLMGGLAYSRIREEFTEKEIITASDSMYANIIEIHISPRGDTTFTYGSATDSLPLVLSRGSYNDYKLYDLPVKLGYEFNFNHWSVALEGEVAINLRLRARGKILDKQGQIQLLDRQGLFKPRTGFSYSGSARLGYSFNRHLQFVAGFDYRSYPIDFMLSAFNEVRQRYNLPGWSAAVQWRF